MNSVFNFVSHEIILQRNVICMENAKLIKNLNKKLLNLDLSQKQNVYRASFWHVTSQSICVT